MPPLDPCSPYAAFYAVMDAARAAGWGFSLTYPAGDTAARYTAHRGGVRLTWVDDLSAALAWAAAGCPEPPLQQQRLAWED